MEYTVDMITIPKSQYKETCQTIILSETLLLSVLFARKYINWSKTPVCYFIVMTKEPSTYFGPWTDQVAGGYFLTFYHHQFVLRSLRVPAPVLRAARSPRPVLLRSPPASVSVPLSPGGGLGRVDYRTSASNPHSEMSSQEI